MISSKEPKAYPKYLNVNKIINFKGKQNGLIVNIIENTLGSHKLKISKWKILTQGEKIYKPVSSI